ncbi:hypothetical protein D9M71_338980 [compost metagenome]
MEQDTGIGFAQHGGVVVRIARRDHPVVQALEGQHRLALGVLLAQLIAGHPTAFVGDQAMAQQRREPQLAHQRLGELVEGVGKNHHLESLAQPVDELDGAVEGLEGGNHFLDVGKLQAMFIENAQALLHQHVVVGNIPGGCPERFDSGFLCEGDPDFRDQYAFQVETGNFHSTLLEEH